MPCLFTYAAFTSIGMSRKQYNSANESKDIEELSRSLSEDLRKSINAITVTPPFKPQWICTARTLDRLARVAEAVSAYPDKFAPWEFSRAQCARGPRRSITSYRFSTPSGDGIRRGGATIHLALSHGANALIYCSGMNVPNSFEHVGETGIYFTEFDVGGTGAVSTISPREWKAA